MSAVNLLNRKAKHAKNLVGFYVRFICWTSDSSSWRRTARTTSAARAAKASSATTAVPSESKLEVSLRKEKNSNCFIHTPHTHAKHTWENGFFCHEENALVICFCFCFCCDGGWGFDCDEGRHCVARVTTNETLCQRTKVEKHAPAQTYFVFNRTIL